jgi:phosphotriesterase-related protein
MATARSTRLSRRDAICLLGSIGASLGTVSAGAERTRVATSGQTLTKSTSPAIPPNAIIRTILEDVAPAALGTGATLFHEHLTLNYASPPSAPGSGSQSPTFDVDLVVEELQAARKDGVHCIVDAATGARTARQLANLKTLASRSGVHIVAAGGYFRAPYPADIASMEEDAIVERLTQNADTERWGAFGEIGTSIEMHPDERKMLRAVTRAHVRTGLPIFTHTPHAGCASCALEQLDICESHGADLRKLCIGHISDIPPRQDPSYETQKAIARRGAFLGFDTVGQALGEAGASNVPEKQKVETILAILEAGYEDHVLLSSDFYNASELKANWGNGFSTVLVQFVPKLRYAGVGEETIRKILADNPRRFLTFAPKTRS